MICLQGYKRIVISRWSNPHLRRGEVMLSSSVTFISNQHSTITICSYRHSGLFEYTVILTHTLSPSYFLNFVNDIFPTDLDVQISLGMVGTPGT